MGDESKSASDELEDAMARAEQGVVDEAARSWIREICVQAAVEDRRCPGALPELLKSLAAVFVAVVGQRQRSTQRTQSAPTTVEGAEDPWTTMAVVCPCASRLFLSDGVSDCTLCDGRGHKRVLQCHFNSSF